VKRVEIFLGPIACSCSGVFSLRDQEKHSQAEMLIAALQDHGDEIDLHVYDPSEDGAYAEYMKKLRGYLRRAGEDDLADRIAFSLKQITPAVAVDGKLECLGAVPAGDDFIVRLIPRKS
jgi:hypothetical protein